MWLKEREVGGIKSFVGLDGYEVFILKREIIPSVHALTY